MSAGSDAARRLPSPFVGAVALQGTVALQGNRTVLEVTGDSVRVLSGPGSADTGLPPALVDAALEWIDDPYGLLDERPVSVAEVWRSLVVTLLGERCESVVVVHPPDWPPARIDRVVAAVNTVAEHVAVLSRDRWPGDFPGRDAWRCEAPPPPDGQDGARRPPRRLSRPVLVLLAGLAVVLSVVAVWVVVLSGAVPWARPGPTVSTMTVAEGRVAARVPAGWTVERVTGGPGSRRLRVGPPGNPDIAVHLTSAYAPESTLKQTAETLTSAIAAEPPGVFVEVNPVAEVAGRPAVTYREVRPGRVIDWSVVLDGVMRISVGCQSVPGREEDVRFACAEAVRTARQK